MIHRRRSLRAAAALLALLLLATAEAIGDEGGDQARRAEAKVLLTEGTDAYARGDYESAWLHFVHAHELVPNPKIYFNIGKVLLKLGHRAEAAEAFDAFLVSTATDAKTDFSKKQEASEALDSLAKGLAKVTLDLSPENAHATVDERTVLAGPVYLLLEPSEHIFEAGAPGYQTYRETVVATHAGNTKVVVHLHLEPVVAKSPVAAIAPLPAPTPLISQGPMVNPPVPKPAVPAPPPLVAPAEVPKMLPSPEARTLTADPVAAPTPATSSVAAPKRDDGPSRLPAYLTWGASGALAVGGLIFGLEALSLGKSIGQGSQGQGQCSDTPSSTYSKNCPTWNLDATLADVFWAGAAAGAVGGTVLFVMAPTFGGGGAGGEVGIVGRF